MTSHLTNLDCRYSFIATILILQNCWMSFPLTEWTLTNSSAICKTQSLSVDISHQLFLGISLAQGLFNCVNTPEENSLVLLAVIWCGLGWQAAWGCRLDESHSSSIINLRHSVHCWLIGGDSKQLSQHLWWRRSCRCFRLGELTPPQSVWGGWPVVLLWTVTSEWACCQKPSLKGQGWANDWVHRSGPTTAERGPVRHTQNVRASDCLHPG